MASPIDVDESSCVMVDAAESCQVACSPPQSQDRRSGKSHTTSLPRSEDEERKSENHASDSDDDNSRDGDSDGVSYQEHPRFRTWKKHVTHLYQQMAHVDLVWESPPAQWMPFMTVKERVATQTILCGTRTGDQEQNYLQFITVSLPIDTSNISNDECGGFSEITGEVGGYGHAPKECGMQVERRMYHDGDVLAARYMHANPLLLATVSSNSNVYVFDWSRISLQLKPNKPERPRGPLCPNDLPDYPSEEERQAYMRRMKLVDEADKEQQAWDKQRGSGQHVLTLTGHSTPASHIEWNTTTEGVVGCGAGSSLHFWQIGSMLLTDSRSVQPFWSTQIDEEAKILDTKFSWSNPDTFVVSTSTGSLLHGDLRAPASSLTELITTDVAVTSLAQSFDGSDRIALGLEDGSIATFDLRNAAEPVYSPFALHQGEVNCVQWCPHRPSMLGCGGSDGIVSLFDTTSNTVLFKHSGHTDTITDINWCWQDYFPFLMVSSDPNAIIAWRPRDRFLSA